jgi:hypothetical protein
MWGLIAKGLSYVVTAVAPQAVALVQDRVTEWVVAGVSTVLSVVAARYLRTLPPKPKPDDLFDRTKR